MSDKSDIAKGEQTVHSNTKTQITSRLDTALGDNTKNELALLGALGTGSAAILKIIATLLAIPDITWTKIAAALLALALALGLMWSIYKIVSSSIDERSAIRETYRKEEEDEDKRYKDQMEKILASP